MISFKLKIVLSLAVAGFLTACGEPKVESKGEKAGFDFTEQKVDGPDISGAWSSACLTAETGSTQKRKVLLSLAGDQVEYRITRFRDEFCDLEQESRVYKGAFKYVRSALENVFEAQIATPVDANTSSLLNFRLRKVEARVFVSDLFVPNMTGGNQDPYIGLTKVANAPVNPRPSPAGLDLEAGLYSPAQNSASTCDLSVSTASMSGVTTSVYLDQGNPCPVSNISLSCRNNLCTSGSVRLEILSPRQFRLTVRTNPPVIYNLN